MNNNDAKKKAIQALAKRNSALTTNPTEDNSDELVHYGRKGMKWGKNIFAKIAAKNAESKAGKEAKKDEYESAGASKKELKKALKETKEERENAKFEAYKAKQDKKQLADEEAHRLEKAQNDPYHDAKTNRMLKDLNIKSEEDMKKLRREDGKEVSAAIDDLLKKRQPAEQAKKEERQKQIDEDEKANEDAFNKLTEKLKQDAEKKAAEKKAKEEAEKKVKEEAEKLKPTQAEIDANNKKKAEKEAKEKAEKEAKEKAEKEAKEKADKEKSDKEKADKEKSDKEKSDKEKSDKEKSDKEKSEKKKESESSVEEYNAKLAKTANKLGKASGVAAQTGRTLEDADRVNTVIAKIKNSKKTKAELKEMDDKQLRDRVNRLNMEQQYKNLTADRMSDGQQRVGNVLKVSAAVAATTASALGIARIFTELLKK